MFLGVEYVDDDEPMFVQIGMRGQAVPVAIRGGRRQMMLVGKPDEYVDRSPGRFQSWPDGDTVTLDLLKNPAGLWCQWISCTIPVKIAVARFYDDDALGYKRAHDLEPGEFLQGVLVKKKRVERVYFVVVPEPGTHPEQDRWWPRVVTSR